MTNSESQGDRFRGYGDKFRGWTMRNSEAGSEAGKGVGSRVSDGDKFRAIVSLKVTAFFLAVTDKFAVPYEGITRETAWLE